MNRAMMRCIVGLIRRMVDGRGLTVGADI